MAKFVVILWIVLMGSIAGGVITYVRMSGTIEELEDTVGRQHDELTELSEAVDGMSRVMRQVVALGTLRSDDDSALDEGERARPRLRDRGGAGDRSGELGEMIKPYRELLDQQLRRKELRAAARERAEADREIYSEEEIDEARELYHSGRGHGGRDNPERRENLEQLVEKYPQSSMAGCALLQLARGSSDGEEAESYYLKAIQGHSDSYCFGGTQVGAIARDRLADYYEESGQEGKAKRLRLELDREYPDAVDHHGDPL